MGSRIVTIDSYALTTHLICSLEYELHIVHSGPVREIDRLRDPTLSISLESCLYLEVPDRVNLESSLDVVWDFAIFDRVYPLCLEYMIRFLYELAKSSPEVFPQYQVE